MRQPVFEPPAIKFEADEDAEPLLDSRRSYLEQLAAYKKFQEKSARVINGEDDEE